MKLLYASTLGIFYIMKVAVWLSAVNGNLIMSLENLYESEDPSWQIHMRMLTKRKRIWRSHRL